MGVLGRAARESLRGGGVPWTVSFTLFPLSKLPARNEKGKASHPEK